MPTPHTTEANHELLMSVSAKVDSLAASLDKLAAHSTAEIDKLWKHVDARDERLTNVVTALSDRLSNFGKPNVTAILSVLAFIGGIALAFIAPIKSDIERGNKASEALAAAVLLRDERIAALRSTQDEVKTKVSIQGALLNDISEHGSAVTRERLAIIEDDLKWMRGEKSNPK